jgi:SOS-response transcriptional repressor LexA
MSSMEEERLHEAMADDPRPTPFVGAGFSAAVTGGAECATWKGLLESGIDVCQRQCPDFPEGRGAWLKQGLEETDADGYLTVADEINRRLRPIGGGREFASWLKGTIGRLTPTSDGKKLIAVVRKIGKIAVTTNYDTLIESQDLAWRSYIWGEAGSESSDMKEHSVVHLHGSVDKPKSVILGTADYAQLVGNELNDVLSKGLFLRHRFIFIGCGPGLVDPHVGPLIEFMNMLMPKGSTEHFILMRRRDVKTYRQKPLSTMITPVSYGDEYEELLQFLEALVPEEAAVAGEDPPVTGGRAPPESGTGLFPRGKAAERKLEDALRVLGRAGDAMWEVDRQRAIPPGIDRLRSGQQEAEHRRLVEALSHPAEELQRCFAEVLEAFTLVEDDVGQLVRPKFARHVSPWIARTVSELEAQSGRLLTEAEAARDDLLERSYVYRGYALGLRVLSDAQLAIQQAHGIMASLYAELGRAPDPERERPVAATVRPAEPEVSSRQQRDAAPSEAAWRVPIAGSAAAGTGNMSAEGEDEFLLIPPARNAQKRNVLAVRVDGDSMTGDDMLDGDYVIIDKARREPRQGEIAVVRIGPSVHADMVVKHVWREEDGLLLKPSDTGTHDSRKVLWNEEPSVEGMVIGVFRPASYRPLSN